MPALNGADQPNNQDNTPGSFANNSGPADAVRSKIAALLDNVTVGASGVGAPNNPPANNPAATPPPTPGRENGGTLNPTPPLSTPAQNGPPIPRPSSMTAPRLTPNGGANFTPPPWPAPAQNPPPPPVAETPKQPAGVNQEISIKGRTDGVAIEIGKGNWAELLANLTERLAQASDFFRGGRVALDIGARPLLEEELQELQTLLGKVGLKLGAVRTRSERTFQAALHLGLAVKYEPGGTDRSEDGAEAQAAPGNHEADQYFVYRGNLRSGQILQRREHILVIGDVNPGAEVISAGDIFVWGRLRGIAHAGADGDLHAVIMAFDLNPVQLQIVDVPGTAPEEPTGFAARLRRKRTKVKQPEIAYLYNHQIIIEPWDESRPGGLAAFRR